ncbi:MAG: hypothetical protein ACFB9M_21120 [Myxococcota bacterium]
MMHVPLFVLGLIAPLQTPMETHVIIVAHNRAHDGSLEPLSFADDDGAKYAELFALTGAKVHLLSVMDAETQALFPDWAARARVPSRRNLERTLERVFQDLKDRRKRNQLYFIYVGHGTLEGNRGIMHLHDGPFSRRRLFETVVAPSPADLNHIVIDACHAYFMVAKRGSNASLDEAFEDFLERDDLQLYPNTGVIVSTSKAREVHEWSRVRAGVFSHELRSGLRGAADASGDGAVTYMEAEAFVAAANATIPDPRARLDIFVAPPKVYLDAPLFDREWTRERPRLEIPTSHAGRYSVHDDRGVRIADFHSGPDAQVSLLLGPRPQFFVEDDRDTYIVRPSVRRAVSLASLYAEPKRQRTRGGEDQQFATHLFEIPFGPAYFEGYRASALRPEPVTVEARASSGPHFVRPLAWATSAAALAAVGTGIYFRAEAGRDAEAFRTAIGGPEVTDPLRDEAEGATRTSNILLGVGGGLAATALLFWLLPDDAF